jgi:aspartyl/glutamyl-tRNA(Asn/Gln) amidotransferase C subunit
MGISRSDVERIAGLARLDLEADELERLTRDCAAILSYFEMVSRLDVEEAEADDVGSATPLRDDRVGADSLATDLAQLAAAWREGFFVLPRLAALDADALDDEA